MISLRFPWFWWGCGSLLLAFVVLGSLLPARQVMPVPIDDKIMHALAYAVLTLWFSGLYLRGRDLSLIAVLMFLLGLMLDMLQGMVSTRTFDLWDVAANGSGILAAWLLARTLLAGWCERVERLLTV